MKYFSSLIVFAMLLACSSIVYADAARPPYPRPRPDITQNQLVQMNIDDRGKLYINFTFPAACDYNYQLVDKKTGIALTSGAGSYKTGEILKDVVADLKDRLDSEKNYFLLKIQMSNIQEQTRFGKKIRRDKVDVTKTVLVKRGSRDKVYDLRVYNGEVEL